MTEEEYREYLEWKTKWYAKHPNTTRAGFKNARRNAGYTLTTEERTKRNKTDRLNRGG